MASPRPLHPAALGISFRADLWIFAYGSLMWNPEFPFRQWAPALVHGYHRALCIASDRWRGTQRRPGLVLGLDRGGACRGIAFRVAGDDVANVLDLLWEREIRRHAYRTRLVHARTPRGEVRALTFVADPGQPGYAGTLSIREAATRVANCRGERGPNLEYLTRTMGHLAELGVHDRYLRRVLAAAQMLYSKCSKS